MAFAITANFLLGTYQGSDSGGRPEPYPSPDRLYKACVAAAYNTFDFERQTDDRVLTDEQIKNALAWRIILRIVFCCPALFHQLAMLFHTETRDI